MKFTSKNWKENFLFDFSNSGLKMFEFRKTECAIVFSTLETPGRNAEFKKSKDSMENFSGPVNCTITEFRTFSHRI